MQKPISAKLSVKPAVVNVPTAIHLRKTCHFPLQRNITDLNIRRLGLEMEKDRFVQGTPVFFCVLPDGKQYIVNGNHTLEAIAYSGKTQLLTFIFLQVDTFDEVAQIYASFDVHKARSWTDALRATGRDKTSLSGKTASAVKLIMSHFRYSPENVEANASRASRFEVFDKYESEEASLLEAMKGAPALNRRLICRAPVLAVALETMRYQPRTAVEFWHGVAQDEGLMNNDPRRALLRYLMTHKSGQGYAVYVMARAAAHGWNAWFKELKVANIRPSIAGKMILYGTPWDGKQDEGDGDGGVKPRKPIDPAGPENDGSTLTDLFETGVRAVEGGLEPVVLYKQAQE